MPLPRRQFLTSALSLPLVRLTGAAAESAAKPVQIGFAYEGIAQSGAVRAKAFQDGLHSRG